MLTKTFRGRLQKMRVEIFNSETFAIGKVGLDRGGRYSYLLRGREVLVAPTLRAGIGTSETNRFPTDSQPIPSQFPADFGIIAKSIHDKETEHNQRNWIDSHISWPICSCNFARIIRLKDMSIDSKEWFEIWERI